MTDYFPLIDRAVAGLEQNTGDTRRSIYRRARTVLDGQLRSLSERLSPSEILGERVALEEAIDKVELEAARRIRAAQSRFDELMNIAPKAFAHGDNRTVVLRAVPQASRRDADDRAVQPRRYGPPPSQAKPEPVRRHANGGEPRWANEWPSSPGLRAPAAPAEAVGAAAHVPATQPREGAWLSGILNRLDAQEPSIDESLASIPRFISDDESIFGECWDAGGGDARVSSRWGPAAEPARVHQLPFDRDDRSQPSILRSGFVEDIAFRLYTDGSIEAKLHEEWLRFDTVDALRLYLSFSCVQRVGNLDF